MNWGDSPKDSMRLFLENMVAEGFLAREVGLAVSPQQIVSTTLDQIDQIARESYPLYQVMSQSDLVFHAEGPGAAQGLPWISALNWLASTAEANLRRLAAAVFDLRGAQGKSLSRKLDLRLSGLAPGSLWMGVKFMPSAGDLLPEDVHRVSALVAEIGALPEIIRFIDDEGLRPGLEEASPDPAMRDVQLESLYRFSPTGQRGIHTLEISSIGSGSASLSQRERVVLKEAISRPNTQDSRGGSLVGRLQEADLDKTRMHLRGVENVGTLRCVMPTFTAAHARAMFGGLVRAEGRYQTDQEGRPRLLFVDRITHIEQKALDV